MKQTHSWNLRSGSTVGVEASTLSTYSYRSNENAATIAANQFGAVAAAFSSVDTEDDEDEISIAMSLVHMAPRQTNAVRIEHAVPFVDRTFAPIPESLLLIDEDD
jgi:hypothetical protein